MKKFKTSNQFYNNLIGKIIYVKYILIKADEIKLSEFIGLCVYYKKNGTFALKNVIKKKKKNTPPHK